MKDFKASEAELKKQLAELNKIRKNAGLSELTEDGLNPYCSGRWSRTRPYKTILIINKLKNSTKQFFTFLNRRLTFS